jgi:hypothetical protein
MYYIFVQTARNNGHVFLKWPHKTLSWAIDQEWWFSIFHFNDFGGSNWQNVDAFSREYNFHLQSTLSVKYIYCWWGKYSSWNLERIKVHTTIVWSWWLILRNLMISLTENFSSIVVNAKILVKIHWRGFIDDASFDWDREFYISYITEDVCLHAYFRVCTCESM